MRPGSAAAPVIGSMAASRPLKIWLINPYGPLPTEGWREYRFVLLGDALAAAGHDVLWWTANFSHHFKRYRSTGWEDQQRSASFRIRLVPTSSYQRNMSPRRLLFEARFAHAVRQRASRESAPDLIVAADPPQTIGRLGRHLAHRLQVPLVLDVMDQWPELFHLALPPWLRGLTPVLTLPFALSRKRNLESADAVTSLCDTYLEHALRVAPSLRGKPQATIFNGIPVDRLRARLGAPLELKLPPKLPGEVWAIYAGSLGDNYDVPTVLAAARALAASGAGVRLIVAGDGPHRPAVERAAGLPGARLTYLGPLSHEALASLYGRCDVGLCPYAAGSNVGMPDKAYDYMAAGLPIVSSLAGELAERLRRNRAGVAYQPGSVESLAGVLEALARDGTLREEYARNSLELGREFDQLTQYEKFPRVVEQTQAHRTGCAGGRG